jgi:hypothetical protein
MTEIYSGHGQKLSRLQERAIAALLSTSTEGQAAEVCGVSVSTLRRWQKQAEFARAFDVARSNILQIVSSELSSGSLEAVRFLREVIRDEKATLSCRIAASRVVLETAWRVHEMQTLANRMSVIEAAVERVQ